MLIFAFHISPHSRYSHDVSHKESSSSFEFHYTLGYYNSFVCPFCLLILNSSFRYSILHYNRVFAQPILRTIFFFQFNKHALIELKWNFKHFLRLKFIRLILIFFHSFVRLYKNYTRKKNTKGYNTKITTKKIRDRGYRKRGWGGQTRERVTKQLQLGRYKRTVVVTVNRSSNELEIELGKPMKLEELVQVPEVQELELPPKIPEPEWRPPALIAELRERGWYCARNKN